MRAEYSILVVYFVVHAPRNASFSLPGCRPNGWPASSQCGRDGTGARAPRRGSVLDAARRDPGGGVGGPRMSILTINVVLSTLVFWVAARI
jgi:hypothetical protein